MKELTQFVKKATNEFLALLYIREGQARSCLPLNLNVEAIEKPKMPKSPLYESISYKVIFRENGLFLQRR
jgi:hypothetical protein